jgi:hypothetical protein
MFLFRKLVGQFRRHLNAPTPLTKLAESGVYQQEIHNGWSPDVSDELVDLQALLCRASKG